MFDPHAQGIRHSKTFERDGPHVTAIDKGSLVAPRKIWKGQCVTGESKKLDNDNKIIVLNNFLTAAERIEFIQESATYEKPPSVVGGSHNRLEYTRNGKPYTFTPNPQKTKSFTSHIEIIGRKILEKIRGTESTEHDLMDSATEYEYGVDMPNGGSVDKMQDNAGDWRHVVFYGLGQTRYLRITKDGARGYINLPLYDNSLVICSGSTFHKKYFHQIDSLPDENPMGTTMLLKTRFRKALLSGSKTI